MLLADQELSPLKNRFSNLNPFQSVVLSSTLPLRVMSLRSVRRGIVGLLC
ncbi:unnamed protein product [Chondrus crispus]|uniref:Uncharacterized protein n=1 Tax=Chondrus crispus TaxID=2769 RepID=R7QKG8_CHOCR|nr:unnamed protein product [Chondrus crispus]CDF37900.1 unnamed protein product [Chondrus crispus]|eukprot:XP_005717771.1 unnamed protein product [Chondrus crispus]